ncbi:hypothetical protein [Methylosinus sp. PW1]|uniref:hypothetical protein n=1 Tax=Methylosinus sp. PW1 TaxID=107636 RepID=UPI000568A588|nr:hypothetical protein [Methylosinus sp. PW1]
MADLVDVETAVVALVADAVYPNGTSQPSAIVGPNGVAAPVKVFAGWPDKDELDRDLKAKKVTISVFSANSVETSMPIYNRDWHEFIPPAPTLEWTVDGYDATISGTPDPTQVAWLLVDGKGYPYRPLTTDGLPQIAAAIAAQIPGASANGATVTVAPPTRSLEGRVSAQGTLIREINRQKHEFLISIWAPNNDLRTAAARVVGPALIAPMWLPLVDGTNAKWTYSRTMNVDAEQLDGVYRRDFRHWAEYPTVELKRAQSAVIVGVQIGGSSSSNTDH